MLKSLRMIKDIAVVLLLVVFLSQVGSQAEQGNKVEGRITQPPEGAQLEKGQVEIVAEGTGFDPCFYADFHYSTDPEKFELTNAIGTDSTATSTATNCTFNVIWDNSGLPDGTYYLRATIVGWNGAENKQENAIATTWVVLKSPSPPGSPTVEIIKPQTEATLERGRVEIVAKGVGFDSCSSASFQYSMSQKDYVLIGKGDSPADCTFAATWDTTDPARVPEGRYFIQVTIYGRKNDRDAQARDEISVYVGVVSLEVTFDWTPSNPSTQDLIWFIISKSPPRERITRYEWDFGDGRRSYEPYPSHKYDAIGTYDVQLTITVKDKDSQQNYSAIKTVNVVDLSVSHEITAFGHLPQENETLPRVLHGSVFRVTVTINVNVNVIAMVLDEGLEESKSKRPVDWEFVRWEASGAVEDIDVNEKTLEWVFKGIAKGTTITVNYYLRVPEKQEGAGKEELYSVTGIVRTGYGDVKLGVKQCKVVGTLPPEVIIAHIKGDGCQAAHLENCSVDPLDDDLVSEAQRQIAEDLWQKTDISLKDAKGQWAAEPDHIDSQLLVDLICHSHNNTPVTEKCSARPSASKGAVSAGREIRAFPPLPPRTLPQVLPGNVFRLTVSIETQEDLAAFSLNEDVDGNDGLPMGWKIADWEPSYVAFRPATLEWIIKGPIKAGQIIEVSYEVVPDEVAVMGTHIVTGTVKGSDDFAIPVTLFSGVQTLPLKIAIAYIKGDGCGTIDREDTCQLDPLDADGAKISDDQLDKAQAFFSSGRKVPHADPAIVTSQVLVELICYNKEGLPVTEASCSATDAPIGQPPTPEESLPIKVAIAHITGESCGAASVDQCRIDALEDDLIDDKQLSIAQDFWQNNVAVPKAISPEGKRPAYITLDIMVQLACYYARRTPVTEPSCPRAGERLVAPANRTVMAFAPLPPATSPQVLPGNLLQVTVRVEVQTDTAAFGLAEDPPADWVIVAQTSRIEPSQGTVSSSFKGSAAEWVFAGQVPGGSVIVIEYSLRVPDDARVDIMASIQGWVTDGLTRSQVVGDSILKVAKGLPIRMVIAHITGDGCGASSPGKCAVDPKLDNLIDERQIQIAQEFWLQGVAVPHAVDLDGRQPAYITQTAYLELLCYYTKQIPVTNSSCSGT